MSNPIPTPEPTPPHGRKPYDRAADRYRCGRSSLEPRCHHGPDWHGHCRSDECKPVLRRQWLSRRARGVVALVGVCALVLVMATPLHREILAPGPLSHVHAQILKGNADQNRCAACHLAGQQPALAWIGDLHQQGVTQQQLCLDCHEKHMPDLVKNLPHDLPEFALQKTKLGPTAAAWQMVNTQSKTVPSQPDPHSDRSPPPVAWREMDLRCGECHKEHQGSKADLQAMTNERCQACHQSRFSSFAQGHPEFSHYPYDRPLQIAFDHRKHRDQHYAKDGKPFDCRNCHVSQNDSGRVGQVFRSVSFEQACASCHNAPIASSLADGLVFFQLPSIDKQKLATSDPLAAKWPDEAGQVMDGTIPPLMHLLLSADPALRESMALLGSQSIDFTKIDLDDANQKQALVEVLHGSQRLLREIAEQGQVAIQSRLATVTQPHQQASTKTLVGLNTPNTRNPLALASPISLAETSTQSALSEGVPPDLFRQAFVKWFQSPTNGPAVLGSAPATRENSTRSSSAADDDLLHAQSPTDPYSRTKDTLAGDPLAKPSRPASDDVKWKPLRSSHQLQGGGWMIDERRMAIVYVPVGHADRFLTAWTGLAKSLSTSAFGQVATIPEGASPNPHASSPIDLFSQAILNPNATGRCSECHQLNPDIRELVTESERGQLPGVSLALWRTQRSPATLRQATRFDHGPHLILPSLSDCVACHRLPLRNIAESSPSPSQLQTQLPHHANSQLAMFDSTPRNARQANHLADFESMAQKDHAPTKLAKFEPMNKNSRSNDHFTEFESMTKKDCANCHTAKAAGDQCTQCHNYHVGEASWKWDRRELPNDQKRIAESLNQLKRPNHPILLSR